MKRVQFFLSALLISFLAIGFYGCKDDDDPKPDGGNNSEDNIVMESSYKGLAGFEGFDEASKTYTMTADKEYVLDGFVFVNYGQTLKIEAGTVIKGKPGDGSNASALIVARGGRIEASGTADKPIIMTGIADDLNGSVPRSANQLWGGLIILGNASNNANNGDGYFGSNIEGIPTSEGRGAWGHGDTQFFGAFGNPTDENGNTLTSGEEVTFEKNDAHDAGFIKYVSIRHGGSKIGANNEINGLTLGAVGNATDIDYVEIWSNQDDGIEWFGGTANIKHAVVSWQGDDALDYDEGFNGTTQFGLVWINDNSLQSNDPRGGEHDGGNKPDDAQPFSSPSFANITYIGDIDDEGKGGLGNLILFRDNAGGSYYRSVFANFQKGIAVEDLEDDAAEDSYKRFLAGQEGGSNNAPLHLNNNLFYNVGGADLSDPKLLFTIPDYGDNTPANPAHVDKLQNAFGAINHIGDPKFGTGAMKVVPAADGAAVENLGDDLPAAFENVNYKGAFAPGQEPWIKGWTVAYEVLSSDN
ncbi:hypothetical protein AAG747_13140 [Rapidithrix thailandica]|uniref:T9SS C-terminal target domain-containing protein n=1 Tax=Rapidithrix thailandica TaxID=413964 RepID=A0AAW9S109_9BACT